MNAVARTGAARFQTSRISHLTAAALLAAPLAFAASPARAERVVLGATDYAADAVVGCTYPLTGRAATYGEDSIEGIRLALADLAQEAATGIPTPALRVIVEDDLSKASYGVRLAEDFIERDGVRFLCGMVSSGVAHAASDLARRKKIILVGTDHASSRLTIESGHRYYFRATNDSWISNAAGARYLRDMRAAAPWKTIAFLNPDYDYGHVSRNDMLEALDELGVPYTVVAELWPKLYEPDYSLYIQALKDAKPDILITALWGGDFLAFLKQAGAAGLFQDMRVANFDTGGNYDVMVALGDTPPPGLILSARHHNNWPDTGYNRRFVAAFRAQTGRYPTYAAEGAYTGIMVIARAIQQAGGARDTEALVAALEGLRLTLPEDPPGYASVIDPLTHQMAQAQAVGTVVRDTRFPPAQVMLGNWRVYAADDLKPPVDLVRRRREAAASGSQAAPVPAFPPDPTP